MKIYLHGVILIDNEIDFERLCHLPPSPHPPVNNVLGPLASRALLKKHRKVEHPAWTDLHVEPLAPLGPSYDRVRVGVSYGMLGSRGRGIGGRSRAGLQTFQALAEFGSKGMVIC